MAITFLGIELGSTRIKSVLVDQYHKIIATGSYAWENSLENGFWTYNLNQAMEGLTASFKNLKENTTIDHIKSIKAIGISGMMHGYLPFDKDGHQLAGFRTWRNTTAQEAADILSNNLTIKIPRRWSIAHFYQAIIDKEPHVKQVAFITTLAGYIHWQLTGQQVLGVGDASGMFPVYGDDYDPKYVSRFNNIWGQDIKKILPQVRLAGEEAGTLTLKGARLLDPDGALKPGITLCPPEGDAATGMVATNSVSAGTGNISAGTSIFAMIVLERNLSRMYNQLDLVATPDGKAVAMVHCNNGCSDMDGYINLFHQNLQAFGVDVDKNTLYETLYKQALEGDPDCGGVLSYNFLSAEPMAGVKEGRPMLLRKPNANFTLPNVMRSLVFSTIASLKLGMKVLEKENVKLREINGHGGFFKTPGVAQSILATALGVPITVMAQAGEGGAWGAAVLAAFAYIKEETLDNYLGKIFAKEKSTKIEPGDSDGFDRYLEEFEDNLGLMDV